MEATTISFLKRTLLVLTFTLLSWCGIAQQQYTVNGEEVMLYLEEEGKLTLLTERSSRDFRFFLKKGAQIEELRASNYKEKLNELTADVELDFRKISFNRRDLSWVVQKYNRGGEEAEQKESEILFRFGGWFGQSNVSSFRNPEDKNIPFFGAEFEGYSDSSYTRNSIIAQLRATNTNDDDDFQLELFEFMLGYRFKLVDTGFFHLYLEAELITFGRYKETYTIFNADGALVESNQTNTYVSAPLGLGAGMAFRIFPSTYFTLGYSNLVKVGESTRNDFPVDIRAGFKFNL